MDFIDLKGPIVADTVYVEGKLVAKDTALTLPAINFATADFRAMGTLTLPITSMIEAMETAITKVGIDQGLRSLILPESMSLEFRFVQDVRRADGSSKTEGCKAFIRGVPKGIPGVSVDPGSPSENEVTIATTRYQLFVGGEEYWLVDQLNTILRIAGKDYAQGINSLL